MAEKRVFFPYKFYNKYPNLIFNHRHIIYEEYNIRILYKNYEFLREIRHHIICNNVLLLIII